MVDRRLGRGLDFFLSGGRQTTPSQPPPPEARGATPDQARDGDVRTVAIGDLTTSPFQPRKTFKDEELNQLAQSLKGSGMLQPILARAVSGKLEIVAGERRWRAAKLAGLQQVPVLVREITDEESAVFGLVENLQREDLNAMEKAEAFKVLMTKLGTTQEEVAKRVGMERSSVANFLRLLDLPAAVQAHVSRGTLSMGHARALLGLADRDLIEKTADETIRQALSVRALEAKIKAANEALTAKPGSKPKASPRERPVWLNELEETLVETLGTPVSIRYAKKRSQITIECAGRDEFERILERLKNC